MTAEQFSAMTQQKIPVFDMQNGEVLYVGYNKETEMLDVGQATNAGLAAQPRFPYDHNSTMEANLQTLNEKLNEMEECREECKRWNTAAVRVDDVKRK